MHSYHNKLLPNHFDEYFISLSSIHYHSTRLATCKNLFLPRVLTLPQENVLLNLSAQKYGLQYQTILNFQPPLPLNGNLRNTYMKKFPIMNFSNILLVHTKILCILVFCNSVLLCVYLLFCIFCVHILCFSA